MSVESLSHQAASAFLQKTENPFPSIIHTFVDQVNARISDIPTLPENDTNNVYYQINRSTEINYESVNVMNPGYNKTLIPLNQTSNEMDYYAFDAEELIQESWLNIFDERFLRHTIPWTIALLLTYTLIFIVGVVGNVMVILVVLLRHQMRSVTNMFIMNLAVADLFVIIFCVPATLLSNVFAPWILGSFMCKGVAYVQGVSVCASAYSLAAISIDRCKAVYRPFQRPSGLSGKQALITTCFIWIFALMLTIPWAVIFEVTSSEENNFTYCIETWENEYYGKLYFLIANFFMCYCIPLILISISNLAIWCHVNHRKVPQNTASAVPIKKMHKKARYGVLKMLGIVTLTFLLSWLPLYIIVTRMKFAENISDSEFNLLNILMPFAQWLGSWNSCINPILYAFLNKKFRRMFRSILPSCFHRKQSNYYVTRDSRGVRSTTNGTCDHRTVRTPSCMTINTKRSSVQTGNSNCSKHLVVSNLRVVDLGTATNHTLYSTSSESGESNINRSRYTNNVTLTGTITHL